MKRAVILLRVSDRNLMARQRFRAMAKRVGESMSGTPVLAAYIVPPEAHGDSPPNANDLTFAKAVEQLAAGGATEIAVVPYLVEWSVGEWLAAAPPPGATLGLHIDGPDHVQEVAEQYPDVRIRLARPLGLGDDVAKAVLRRCDEAWSLPEAEKASGTEMAQIAGQGAVFSAKLRDGEAPRLPPHDRHVLLCTSRRCTDEGALKVYGALGLELDARGLSPESALHGLMGRQKHDAGEEGPATTTGLKIKLTRTRCLGPCAGATVACLYPGETFYWGLTPTLVPAFVDDLVAGGGTMTERTFRAGK